MIQVNTANVASRSGIHVKHFKEFWNFTKSLNIPVNGLMCIPPINDNPSIHFCILRELANKYNIKNLSMGMSSDYNEAIKFGASHLRIGSSFFGKRL